jgi:hypothetical protein
MVWNFVADAEFLAGAILTGIKTRPATSLDLDRKKQISKGI